MRKRISYLSAIFIFAFVFCALAHNGASAQSTEKTSPLPISDYQKYIDLTNIPKSDLPQVIELPFDSNSMLLIDLFDMSAPPIHTFSKTEKTYGYSAEAFVPSNTATTSKNSLLDSNPLTYTDLPINSNGYTSLNINVDPGTDKYPNISGFEIVFDQYSQKPTDYEIQKIYGPEGDVIIAKKAYAGDILRFPSTLSDVSSFEIKFFHNQPLRITDIKLITDIPYNGIITKSYARFAALSNHSYRIYTRLDTSSNNFFYPETAYSLQNPVGNSIKEISLDGLTEVQNPAYTLPDLDKDGIPNTSDNCPKTSNADQIDKNFNNVGDACDDFDQDGVFNSVDNCPELPNTYQEDEDGDKIGDKCDGEESRVSEKYPWLPWLGIVVGFAVTGGVLAISLHQKPKTRGVEDPVEEKNKV